MKNKFFKKGYFISLLALLFLFNGCNLDNNENPAPEPIPLELTFSGTWDDAGWEKEITENSFGTYAEIVKLVKNEYNGGEQVDSDNAGIYGYSVLKYNDSPDKYGIVRFKSLKKESDVVTMSYSEGYKKLNPSDVNDYTGIYFTSISAAEAGMTEAQGFFNYSTGTKKSQTTSINEILTFSGTWDDSGWEKKISETTFGSYAQIVKLIKGEFNNGEAVDSDNSGLCGYGVLKYNDSPNKYGIVRFKSLKITGETITMDYSEGYKKLNPSDANDYTGIYFDSAAEAEAGMTAADGFFYYSTGTKK